MWLVFSMLAHPVCSLDFTRKHSRGAGMPGTTTIKDQDHVHCWSLVWQWAELRSQVRLILQWGKEAWYWRKSDYLWNSGKHPCGYFGIVWKRGGVSCILPQAHFKAPPLWLPSVSLTTFLHVFPLCFMITIHIFPHCLISVLVDNGCPFIYPTQKTNTIFYIFCV